MDMEWYFQPLVAWAMQAKAAFIKTGGVFNAVFAVLHLSWPWLYDWREDLRTLTFVNRSAIRVLNLSVVVVLAIFAYISLAHTADLLSSALGFAMLASMALFWLVRTIHQIVVFGLRRWRSWGLFLALAPGVLLYGVPAALIAWPAMASY